MKKNKDQHYVSAFYLYNFTSVEQRLASKGKQHRETNIHHYDFDKKCLKERSIKNVATKSYLLSYKTINGTYDHSLDNEVLAVEDKAATAIEELNDILKYALKKKPRAVELKNTIIDNVMQLLFWQIKRHPEIVDKVKKDCERVCVENNKLPQDAKKMALEVIRQTGKANPNDVIDELHKKNKIILCTSTSNAHFITTDKPFVRFNKNGGNGINVQNTEMYFPITSNMLLFMNNNGIRKEILFENNLSILHGLNRYIGKSASKYLFGPSKIYLERIVKEIGLPCVQ